MEWELKEDSLNLDQMKFPGWNLINLAVEILGLIEDAIRKPDNIIFLVGLKVELNNIEPLNKPRQDVKDLIMFVVVLLSIKGFMELGLNIDL